VRSERFVHGGARARSRDMRYLVALLVLAGACARPVPLDNHRCPCLDGYLCCPARNECLPAGQGCAGEDAGPTTPDLLAPDLAPAPAPDLAEGPNELTADHWTALSSAGAPSPRGSVTAVWTGREMIVWGGLPSVSEGLAAGGRYDPTSDRWRTMATLHGPSAGGNQYMIWTGKEALVWGVVGEVDLAGKGSRYDPATDTWTPMSTEGAPNGRGCAAAWTGDRMVVWGGTKPDGASYDPTTDRWTPLSRTGAPAAPIGPTATWTGHEVLFFGGVGPDVVRAGVGLYDPASDRWRSLPEEGAPGRRYIHSAVFAGHEVIIWGGAAENGGDVTPVGAAFDVAANRWRPLGTIEQPTQSHPAIWAEGAGTRGTGLMLVGTAAYDPRSDRWWPTTLDGPRGSWVAVWTGQDLLVFGSSDDDKGLPQLARYRP
jgi:hypothetical protein